MFPILARYGSFFLYSYTLVMGLGLLLAVGAGAWELRTRRGTAEREAENSGEWLDGVLWGLAVGLVVGRLVFVAVNWAYFRENLEESLWLWRGGISYHGAVFGGTAALWLWARRRNVRFVWLGDLLAIAAALWSVAGWLACYLDGCAYGRETFMGLPAADLPDSYGVFAVRYQIQLIGMALSLLALLVLVALRRQRLREGTLWWAAVLLLSASRAAVGAWRGDEMVVVGALRLDVVLDTALAMAALAMLVVRKVIS